MSAIGLDEVRLRRSTLQDHCAQGDDRRVDAGLRLRRGTGADADIAAEVYLRARHGAIPEIPPLVHSDDEVRRWMRGVLGNQEVWLAFADRGALVGLLVVDGNWVGQLYVDPAWTGRGLGTRFLELGKRRRPDGLQLWTFVSNVRAQRFYERNGFAVRGADRRER